MNIEMIAAQLEADQANRDFMAEWINAGRKIDGPECAPLRYYRGAAERLFDSMIVDQIAAISLSEQYTHPEDAQHVEAPHWPGTYIGCPGCEVQMAEAYEGAA